MDLLIGISPPLDCDATRASLTLKVAYLENDFNFALEAESKMCYYLSVWACCSPTTPMDWDVGAPTEESEKLVKRRIFTPQILGLWSSGTMPHSHCGDVSSILARSTKILRGALLSSEFRP